MAESGREWPRVAEWPHTGIELRSQDLVEGIGAVTSVGIVSAPDWIGFFNQVGFFQDSFGILSGVFQDSSLKLVL